MTEYIDRETILDDLDLDIKVTNKRRLLAKERHCVEDRMNCAKTLNHLRGFSEYIKSQPTVRAISLDKVKKAREEIDDLARYFDNDCCSDNRDSMFKCSEVLEILDKLIAESEENNEDNG